VVVAIAVVWLATIGLLREWILSIEALEVCAESVVIGQQRHSLPTNGYASHLRIADSSPSMPVLAVLAARRRVNGGRAAVW
jgi:hypothetical protein